jgi:hypothetical protein
MRMNFLKLEFRFWRLDYEEYCYLLGCDALLSVRSLLAFQRKVLLPSSRFKLLARNKQSSAELHSVNHRKVYSSSFIEVQQYC